MTKKHLFSWLLKKAVLMALWTKASLCVKSSLLKQSLPRTQRQLISLRPLWLFSLFLCVFCAFLWLKNPRNLRNPWLINDLRAYNALYNCRETFTDVMSALQIRLFMQNEPKFPKSQMNVTKALTTNYENKDTWSTREKRTQNEPKTNPIKANLQKAEMNVNKVFTKEYENKLNWAIYENKANFKGKKMLLSTFILWDI
jgi:hypothetical protein